MNNRACNFSSQCVPNPSHCWRNWIKISFYLYFIIYCSVPNSWKQLGFPLICGKLGNCQRLASDPNVCVKCYISSDWCGSVGWSIICKPKCHWFNSWSGHMPRLWIQSPVGAHMRGSRSMFLSRIDVSLSPSSL